MRRLKLFGKKTFSSLSIRNYRLYFIGQAISLSGTWMQTIAQGWLVLELTHSGTQLGLVVACQFLPLLFLGPWGGLVADRVHKQTILYYANAVSAGLSFGLSILVFSHAVQLWELYVFAGALGFVRVFDNPARQTFVSEMVGGNHLKNAVSLNATANNLARAVGPSISGLLIAGVGIAFCFFVNALSFIVSMYLQYLMRPEELHQREPISRPTHALREGFAYVRQTPLIFNTLIMMTVVGTFVFEFQVSLPLVAQETFHGNAASYALLMSTMGVGSVVGGLFAAGRSMISPKHLVVFLGLCGVSLCIAASMPTLILTALAMFVVGFFTINVTSLANTMLQLKSRPEMRGRVMALWGMAMMGSTPIGGPLVGMAGEYGGGRCTLLVGGIAALFAAFYGVYILRGKDRETVIPKEVHTAVQQSTTWRR